MDDELEQLKTELDWHKRFEWEQRRLKDAGCSLDFVHAHMEQWQLANPRPNADE